MNLMIAMQQLATIIHIRTAHPEHRSSERNGVPPGGDRTVRQGRVLSRSSNGTAEVAKIRIVHRINRSIQRSQLRSR